MAHFRATLQGNRGQTSRLGTEASGIGATVRGWDVGVSVDLRAEKDGDVAFIAVDGGSNRPSGRDLLQISVEDFKGILDGRLKLAVVEREVE